MPPKPSGKKGEADDLSDIASLPKANVFKFTLVHKQYFDKETREKVKKAIADKLVPSSCERVKMLTREEIVTYGKSKGIIVEAGSDSRRLSEAEMIAKSAADRIFEINVQFRRHRKERQAAVSEENPFDPDLVDGFIYLVDFPQTETETLALSKYSQSLNAVFEINEIPKPPEDKEESENEADD